MYVDDIHLAHADNGIYSINASLNQDLIVKYKLFAHCHQFDSQHDWICVNWIKTNIEQSIRPPRPEN